MQATQASQLKWDIQVLNSLSICFNPFLYFCELNKRVTSETVIRDILFDCLKINVLSQYNKFLWVQQKNTAQKHQLFNQFRHQSFQQSKFTPYPFLMLTLNVYVLPDNFGALSGDLDVHHGACVWIRCQVYLRKLSLKS